MKTQITNFVLALILTVLASPSIGATNANVETEISDQMLAHLKVLIEAYDEPDAPMPDRGDKVASVIDLKAITRGVLGKHGKTMSEEQKSLFQTQFEHSISALLAFALKGASTYDVTVESVRISPKRDDRAQVLGVLTTPQGDRFELLSSVAKGESGWLVRNLIVNGINLGITYRNQFAELVTKHDSIDLAIGEWKEAAGQIKQ